MFLKENIKKARSLFGGFAFAGVAAAALIWGANTATINAQEAVGDATKTSDEAVNAPSGGAANKFLDFYDGGTGNFASAGRTDFVTLAFPPVGTSGPIRWNVLGNPASPVPNAAFIRRFDYGISDQDSIVVGDYTGDSKTELTVFRESPTTTQGIWYVSQFPTGSGGVVLDRTVRFGLGTDNAVTGDYDGGGKADYAIVRVLTNPSTQIASLFWYIMSSETNTMRVINYGQFTGAVGPTLFSGADYNGDGRDELVYVTRNSAGTIVNYFLGDAVTGQNVQIFSYGNYNTDTSLTPADYTGDGRADIVAVRQTAADGIATWYILNSATGVTRVVKFGIADPSFIDGDIPVRGDYDGDNIHDVAVWRASNRTFYYISSRFSGSIQSQQFGETTDFPLGAFGQY